MICSDGEADCARKDTMATVLARERPALLLLSLYHDFLSHDWASKALPMRSIERV